MGNAMAADGFVVLAEDAYLNGEIGLCDHDFTDFFEVIHRLHHRDPGVTVIDFFPEATRCRIDIHPIRRVKMFDGP